ncbi:MAG: hypothetical protein JWN63_17 [Candidatus Acidoferrum typicum]|nr:hypothetical protein [Candidatus Acidoferrum typicum]
MPVDAQSKFNRPLPSPWKEFLSEIDSMLKEPLALRCIGGFVICYFYGLPRTIWRYLRSSGARMECSDWRRSKQALKTRDIPTPTYSPPSTHQRRFQSLPSASRFELPVAPPSACRSSFVYLLAHPE